MILNDEMGARLESWLRAIAPKAPRRIARKLLRDMLKPIPPNSTPTQAEDQFLAAATVLSPRPAWLTAALTRLAAQVVVVLNDGETWSSLAGCKFVRLTNAEINDPEVDEIVKERYRELDAEPISALDRTVVVVREKGPAP